MKLANVKRDELGRVVGSHFEFFVDEDESYTNLKVKGDLLFPSHNDQSSPVTTYTLNPEELAVLRNK
jgi:hypothetical protein